jgi:hypothetical protein
MKKTKKEKENPLKEKRSRNQFIEFFEIFVFLLSHFLTVFVCLFYFHYFSPSPRIKKKKEGQQTRSTTFVGIQVKVGRRTRRKSGGCWAGVIDHPRSDDGTSDIRL